MRTYGEKQVTKRIVTETMCDGCGKRKNGEPSDPWVHFKTWHNDWDNDSVESIKDWDACSGACFHKTLKRVVSDYEPLRAVPTLEISLDIFGFEFAKELAVELEAEDE